MDRTAKEYKESVLALASEAFENHRIVSRQEWGNTLGSWTIARPDSSIYWTQICTLEGGRILAHGDIEPVIFGNGDGRTHLELLGWIAKADFDYCVEKARIGSRAPVTRVDEDIARNDLARRIAELGQEEQEHRITSHRRRVLGEALTELRDGVPWEIVRVHAYDEGRDPELLEGIGEVVDAKVFYAHQAIVRLHRLLLAEQD